MQPTSDAQLLRDYAQHHADAAFTELVQRHTNLVYSAAVRQVDSPDVAAEIAQNVFIGLARSARNLSPKLSPDASLAGWLCRSARNLSLNHRRDEFRRLTRERHAMEQLTISDDAPNWEHLRCVLDDAMAELTETDYDALVLRFYQNQDLRTVGATIGVSDDTAQKRVARALDKLRELLSQRGIRTTAGALGIVISANAVQAAPLGLAVSISAAALTGTAVTTTTVIAATTKTIAMTTLQKTLVSATVAVLAGVGIYEARQTALLREQVQTFQQQQTPFAEQIQQLQEQQKRDSDTISGLNEQLANSAKNNSELLTLRGQVGLLRSQLADARQAAPKTQYSAISPSASNEDAANKAMFDFLGSPVSPPTNMDFAYTKQGLINAVQSAAQSANITLANLFIDDSEFPFLVGVVFQNKNDAEKLKAELQKLAGYNYSGSVSGDTVAAMDIIPNSAYPTNTQTTIANRKMLRQSMLYQRIRTEKGH